MNITFPKGTAVWPALITPDTKFDELGQYKADFKISLEEAEPFMEDLQAAAKGHLGKKLPAKDNVLWVFETDEDGNETGMVLFKARVKNRMNKKGELWDRQPKMIGADTKPVKPSGVRGGTVMRVQCEVVLGEKPKRYIKLQPIMVQIIKLVEGGGDVSAFQVEDDADVSGFETESADVDENDVDDEIPY